MNRVASIVALVLVFGCAGAIEPSDPAERGTLPEPAAEVMPEPAAMPEPEPTPEPKNPIFIGGPGFWCSDRPAESSGSRTVGECYRMQESCDHFRAKREKQGTHWTPCRAVDRAACFTMADVKLHGVGFRCFDSLEHCALERPSYISKRQDGGRQFRYGECEWTSRAELQRGEVVAHAAPYGGTGITLPGEADLAIVVEIGGAQ